MESSEIYSQARRARRNLDTGKAISLFELLIEQYPDSREAGYALSQLADIKPANEDISSAFSGTLSGEGKHETIDWNKAEITPGRFRLHRADCSISLSRITIVPDWATGENIRVNRNSRTITKYFTLFGFRFFKPTIIHFDDVVDVCGSYDQVGGISGDLYAKQERMRSYHVMIKTKQGATFLVARSGVQYRGYFQSPEDTFWNGSIFENELRKMIFMPK